MAITISARSVSVKICLCGRWCFPMKRKVSLPSAPTDKCLFLSVVIPYVRYRLTLASVPTRKYRSLIKRMTIAAGIARATIRATTKATVMNRVGGAYRLRVCTPRVEESGLPDTMNAW